MRSPTEKSSTLLAITCYNCAGQIGRVIDKIAKIEHTKYFQEIIVFDNHSKDETCSIAGAALQKLNTPSRVVKNNGLNYGLGGSHKSAFAHAQRVGHTHVVILHGDDQASISDLTDFLMTEKPPSHTHLLGARFHPKSILRGYSKFRTFGNIVYNWLFSIATGRRFYDLGSGLNLYVVEDLKGGWYEKYADDLTFNYYFFLGLQDRGAEVMYFPITWTEEDQVSNVKLTSQAIRVLKLLLTYIFSRKNFRSKDHRSEVIEPYSFTTAETNSAFTDL